MIDLNDTEIREVVRPIADPNQSFEAAQLAQLVEDDRGAL